MLRQASLILLSAQGMPFLHGGQEFGRTKQGRHNSYDAGDAINAIDWSLKRARGDVFDYVRGLIAIRRAHPVLRLARREQVEARGRLLPTGRDRLIAWQLDGTELRGETARRMLVLYNGGAETASFTLPEGSWRILADADRADPAGLGTAGGTVIVPPHGGLMLCR